MYHVPRKLVYRLRICLLHERAVLRRARQLRACRIVVLRAVRCSGILLEEVELVKEVRRNIFR